MLFGVPCSVYVLVMVRLFPPLWLLLYLLFVFFKYCIWFLICMPPRVSIDLSDFIHQNYLFVCLEDLYGHSLILSDSGTH